MPEWKRSKDQNGKNLARADAENLAEQQGEDLRFVLGGLTEERHAQGQHRHEGQRRGDVGLALSPEQSDARAASKEKTPSPGVG